MSDEYAALQNDLADADVQYGRAHGAYHGTKENPQNRERVIICERNKLRAENRLLHVHIAMLKRYIKKLQGNAP